MNPPPGTLGTANGQSGPIQFMVSLDEPHVLIWPYPDGAEYEWNDIRCCWERYDEGVYCSVHFDCPTAGEFVSFRLDGSPVDYGPYS